MIRRSRFHLLAVVLTSVLMVTSATLLTGQVSARAAADVLMLGPTLQGGTASPEYQAAQALGLSVEIVDGPGWMAKTTTDFAAYKAIVLGDPNCAGDPSPAQAATNSTSVWSPAITGNVIVVGTDPDFHYLEGIAGASGLIERGIKLATRQSGHTGAYITLSCYFSSASSPTPVPFLAGLSGGTFSVVGQAYSGNSCPNRAHVVDVALAGIFDNDLSNWSCSTHEAFTSWPSDYRVLAINQDVDTGYVDKDGTRGGPYIVGLLAPGTYVAFGDSFSAGEGVPPFIPPTDTDNCHRSFDAYSQVLSGLHLQLKKFVACSGGRIKNVFFGQNGEPPQLDALQPAPGDPGGADVITISMGGNDIGFSGVATQCVIVGVGCEWFLDDTTTSAIKRIGQSGATPAIDSADGSLSFDDPKFNLDRLYAGIRAKAPQARIIVLGYPRLLKDAGLLGCNFLFQDEIDWINSIETLLNSKIAASAARTGAEYISGSFDAYAGHELCTSDPWVNDLHLFDHREYSFHPNAKGQQKFADEVKQQITAGASGAPYLVMPGSTTGIVSSVASSLGQVSFSTTWPGSDVVMSLVSPSGRQITRSTTDPDVIHIVGPTYEVFTVTKPEAGNWTVNLFGANVLPHGENVRFVSTPMPRVDDPPRAVFTASTTGGAPPLAVAFDATGSSDPDGRIVNYSWDFGDGSVGTGLQPSHTYTSPGQYKVHLTVTDDSGSKGFGGTIISVKGGTRLTYTGPTAAEAGTKIAVSASLTDDSRTPLANRNLTFTLGTGTSATTCTATTAANGMASCSITASQGLGPQPVSVSFGGDAYYQPSSAASSVILYAWPAQGSFIVGTSGASGSSVVTGQRVTFWGSQWASDNSLKSGSPPAQFKGFEASTSRPSCGSSWTASPGNSGHPPSTVPTYMAVVVSNSVTSSGSTISGNSVSVVIVKTDLGYGGNSGHNGTGTVVAVVC